MGKGVNDTPPAPPQESGTRLEQLVFGDELHIYRDLRVGDSDCGVCPNIIASVRGQLFKVTDFRYRLGPSSSKGESAKMNLNISRSNWKQLMTPLI